MNLKLDTSKIKVRKGTRARAGAVHRDRTKYTRKRKHKHAA